MVIFGALNACNFCWICPQTKHPKRRENRPERQSILKGALRKPLMSANARLVMGRLKVPPWVESES